VLGLIAGADRDPSKFREPTCLDFTRNNEDSLVFAPGPHFCLGHLLAKMQLSEFISALVNRAGSIDVLDAKLAWMPVFTFRGLYKLNVRINPRRVRRLGKSA
jgi:cytochrome P450